MAKAKKLPSGSWRCLVYSHTENKLDENGQIVYNKNGTPKQIRKYESFTSDDKSPNGKREAEFLASQFALEKDKRTQSKYGNYTLRQAIDKHIESMDAILSPTTIRSYNSIKKYCFQDIMDTKVKELTADIIQASVNLESKRKAARRNSVVSPKTVKNNYGLITVAINKCMPGLDLSEVKLPVRANRIKELPPPEVIYEIVKGTEIELAVMLSMWLSYSKSEIRGLTKSKSISKDGYITVNEVLVDVGTMQVRKEQAKTQTRTRRLKIPPYIQHLIDETDPNVDELVTLSGTSLYKRFTKLIKKNGLPHMTFHDLRHINASVMAVLQIPDKYAQERGGWKTDQVMKKVYTHTFSDYRIEADKKVDTYFEGVINGLENVSNYRVKQDFDYFNLLQIGYIAVPLEGGYMSPDAATMVYQNKKGHQGEVTPFMQDRDEQHKNNIETLRNLGYIE